MFCIFLFLASCKQEESGQALTSESVKILTKLSEYGILQKPFDNSQIRYREDGFLYDLNTPLFSDYAEKERVLFLPQGTKMVYHSKKEFQLPVGSIISKTFLVPEGFQRADGKSGRILETRLLIHQKEGWFAVSYIWDGKDEEASIAYAGGNIPIRTDEGEVFTYAVPSRNQCASCHQNYEEKKQSIVPIGLKAKHLNKDRTYVRNGETYTANQLREMESRGLLKGLPFLGVPKIPPFQDTSYPVSERARGYLDINCAHCHNENAAAGINSQLVLSYEEKDIGKLGFCTTPSSAGKGGGGLRYDIVPGHPENSILYYRIQTRDPGAMMPQLGRALTHREGAELIREWILAMAEEECP